MDARAQARRGVALAFPLVVAGTLAFACLPRVAFECGGDGECSRFGDGRCEEGNCVYPDDTCLHGERYSRYADPSVANACVRPETGSNDSGSTGLDASDSGSTADASTGPDVVDAGDSPSSSTTR